jgi:hypothetical protein
MRERPILFSGPMVRAILEGRKTQTRRVVPTMVTLGRVEYPGRRDRNGYSQVNWLDTPEGVATAVRECPYGAPGGRLWVRENGWERPALSARDLRDGADTWPPYEYDAEPLMSWADGELKRIGWRRRPSIHMPRWASRITLEVTGVRVERLQDISSNDAIAEGIEPCPRGGEWRNYLDSAPNRDALTPRVSFRSLWESINGPGSWEANPYVWAVSFREVSP